MERPNTAKSDLKINSSSNGSNEQPTAEKTSKKKRNKHKKKNFSNSESDLERKTETSEVIEIVTNEENTIISTEVIDLTGDDIQEETETQSVVVEKKGKGKRRKKKSMGQGTVEDISEDGTNKTKNNIKTVEKGAIKKIPSEIGSGKADDRLENKSGKNKESFNRHKNDIPMHNQNVDEKRNFRQRTITNSSRNSENYNSKDNPNGYKSSKKQNRQNYGSQIDKQNQRDRNNPWGIKKEVAKTEVESVKSNLSPEAQEFKSQSLNDKDMVGVKGFRSANTKPWKMKQETYGEKTGISKQDNYRRSDETYDSWNDSVSTANNDSVNSSLEKMSLKNKSADVMQGDDWTANLKTEDLGDWSANDYSTDLKNKSEDLEVSQESDWGLPDIRLKKNNYASDRGNFRKDRDIHSDRDDRWRDNRGSDQYRDSRNQDRGSWRRSRNSDDTKSSKVKEVNGDLFEAPVEYSLAHCVAEDFRMGSGIAVQFKQQFKRVDELLAQRAKTGGLAYLEEDKRFIYYLVTKKVSNGKPTLKTLESSLNELKKQILENNVKKLAMPRIGCGLDRLEWRDVKSMLNEIFADVDIEIVVYNFQQNEKDGTTPTRDGNKPFITHQQLSLVDIAKETGLLFIGYENGFVTPEIDSLDRKYKFIQDYKFSTVQTGDVFRIEKRGEVLYGLIIAKTENDPFDFIALNKCLKTVRNLNKEDGYYYFGIEAFIDSEDDVLMDKICTLIKNNFRKEEFWICWPKPLKHLMP